MTQRTPLLKLTPFYRQNKKRTEPYQMPTKRPWLTSEVTPIRPFAIQVVANQMTRKEAVNQLIPLLTTRTESAIRQALFRVEEIIRAEIKDLNDCLLKDQNDHLQQLSSRQIKTAESSGDNKTDPNPK